MPSKYRERQRTRAIELINSNNSVFRSAKGGGRFMGKQRDFVLTEYEKNLYKPIKDDAIAYFDKNRVGWWGGKKPSAHLLSSQVACVNHLFAIRNDKQAVLSILQSISPNFEDVLQITTDSYAPAYIQFEAVSDTDHLNEGVTNRGSNCTSVDALIWAVRNGENWLVLIEWKYTEHYSNENKATEGARKDPVNNKGTTRKDRYTDLINQSQQLKSEDHYCYYFEPFYQLMRQTLWAEQIINHKATETIKANNFLHLHIIPPENSNLLHKQYKCSGKSMENTWRSHLKDDSRYMIVSPEELLKPIDQVKYRELIEYLRERYWG